MWRHKELSNTNSESPQNAIRWYAKNSYSFTTPVRFQPFLLIRIVCFRHEIEKKIVCFHTKIFDPDRLLSVKTRIVCFRKMSAFTNKIIRLKVDGPSDESKCRSGRSKSIKVDGLRVSKWTVWGCKSGRSEGIKMDGLRVSKWTV